MSEVSPASPCSAPAAKRAASARLQELREWFGAEFSQFDGNTGNLEWSARDGFSFDDVVTAELVRAVSRGGKAEVIAEAGALLVLAIPLNAIGNAASVAVGKFLTTAITNECEASAEATALGASAAEVVAWAQRQTVWPARALIKLAEAVTQKFFAEVEKDLAKKEVEKLSDNLSSTYEEISLLYGVTRNLRISSSENDMGRLTLDWLIECVPAESVAIYYAPVADADEATYQARTEASLIVHGECPLDVEQLEQLIQELELGPGCGPHVANLPVTQAPGWPFPEIRQLIVAPLSEGENLFGWLVAFNHVDGLEFGTVEASLLSSVAAILGTHSGNVDLYRQQREFLASVVQAMTSAIDAKDPYTCGHSDRVARISVRLAQELGCDDETLNTLYMAGLVHDIGKIGINDSVLRKPGRLTAIEFEQIKMHPELGCKILADIKQLSNVLPVVLHHHEQWDGSGYPHQLVGEDIPWLARICAVADAYDAMSSDRPYRKGMPEEKVHAIFQGGSGSQWDPDVVNAFFTVQADIRKICRRERANLTLDVGRWADTGKPLVEPPLGAIS